jgi:MoxR-like ATPase
MADAGEVAIEKRVGLEESRRLREVVELIYIDDKIKDYVVDMVQATRFPGQFGLNEMEPLIEHGASPRATIFLARAARAHAFIQRRGYVTPEDVKAVGGDVLRHRIIASYEAEAEEIDSEQIVQQLFDHIEVP